MTDADSTEEIVYEEVPEPQVIETGDSVKVKQVLDEATTDAFKEYGYEPNYFMDNLKLIIMFTSCVFAMVAQFYPLPFPASRPLLGVCCVSYFALNGLFQFIVTFIDKDTIIITKPNKVCTRYSFCSPLICCLLWTNLNLFQSGNVLRIRTSFPRFQEYFTLIIQSEDPKSPETTAKMYVGRYFTEKGAVDLVMLNFMKF